MPPPSERSWPRALRRRPLGEPAGAAAGAAADGAPEAAVAAVATEGSGEDVALGCSILLPLNASLSSVFRGRDGGQQWRQGAHSHQSCALTVRVRSALAVCVIPQLQHGAASGRISSQMSSGKLFASSASCSRGNEFGPLTGECPFCNV